MKTNKRFKKILSTLAIAALILTGSAPYFAFAEPQTTDAEQSAETEITSLATYDDSKVPATSGRSVVLMNAENGDIIYEKNAHQLFEPASITKILTCLVACETLDLNQEVTVPEGINGAEVSLYLEPGEKLTVEQLLYGAMLASGNDAAEVLAVAVAGSQKEFAKMLNARAKECGALDSVYKNPNGLNEDAAALNVTTAYDQAVITREAMKNKDFRQVVSTAKYTIPKTNKSKARKLKNTNKCLWASKAIVDVNGTKRQLKYDDCTGVKTGYTTSAGNCFVGTAQRGNMELIVVTFMAADSAAKFTDAIALWEYGFKNYKTYTAAQGGTVILEQKVKEGSLAKVEVGLKEDFDITMDKDYDEEDQITTEVELKEETPTAPIEKGAVMGTISAYDRVGNLVGVQNLLALEKVEKGGLLSKIGIADEYAWIFWAALALLVLVALIQYIRWRKQNPRQKTPRSQKPAKKNRTEADEAEVKEYADAGEAATDWMNENMTDWRSEGPRSAADAEDFTGAKAAADAPVKTYKFSTLSEREIAPPLSSEMAKYREQIRQQEAARQADAARQTDVRDQYDAARRAKQTKQEPKRRSAGEAAERSPRGERTAAEKRAIRRESARRRRNQTRDDL